MANRRAGTRTKPTKSVDPVAETRPQKHARDPGITRERLEDEPPVPLTDDEKAVGKKPRQPIARFRYYYLTTGQTVSPDDFERIRRLGIPPAYQKVWVSSNPKTAIQATAKDDRNRTQYRYHTAHTLAQDQKKYARVIKFMKALPRFLERLDKDVSTTRARTKVVASREAVIAWMLKIMMELNIRIGNDCYAKENDSYGLSTLEHDHVSFKESRGKRVAVFTFLGKSKQHHALTLRNPDAVAVVEALLRLPGPHVFQYVPPAEKTPRRIKAADVNEYLRRHMGTQFSCKDFRTYAANRYFLEYVRKETRDHPPTTQKQKKLNLRNALAKAAEKLGHKPSISKKSYVRYLSDMYLDDPGQFTSRKHIDTLLTELFRVAVKEHRTLKAGAWSRVYRHRDCF
jgi:DNA topoisomerase-1